MKSFWAIIIVSILSASLTSVIILSNIGESAKATSSVQIEESVYDRVLRTGRIKCGYGIWDPIMLKDPNTGKLSGIFYEYMEALAKKLNLKVEWREEIGWGEFGAALNQDRIDMMCSGIWPTAERARSMDFTRSIYYHPMYAWVRSDDQRFDNNLESANNENITFSAQDGTIALAISQEDFPKAEKIVMQQFSGQTEMLLNVTSKKADIVIQDKISVSLFLETNPGSLKQVEGIGPLRFFGNTMAIKTGEYEFQRMIDHATQDLLQSGVMDKIIDKYEKYPDSLLRVSAPYQHKRK